MKLQTKTYRVKGEWIYTWRYRVVATRQNGEEAEEEQDHLNVKGKEFGEETGHNRSEAHSARWIRAFGVPW